MINTIVKYTKKIGNCVSNVSRKALACGAVGLSALGLMPDANAAGPTYDLSAVTTAVSGLKTDVLAAFGTVIPYGLALAAVSFGGVYVWRLFKRFTK